MMIKRTLGALTAVAAFSAVAVLYAAHPAKSSDHQDTFNLATRGGAIGATPVGHSADITDVFVFPGSDPSHVVFAMNVSPLVLPGTGPQNYFDPSLLYQFKISHQDSGMEDQVIQVAATGASTSQSVSVYGPAAPNEVGTTNTLVSKVAATTGLGQVAPVNPSGVTLFAGPRTDPFFFDLFAFFTFLGDRNFDTHTSQSDPGFENMANPEGLGNGDDSTNTKPLVQKYAPYDNTGNNPGPNKPANASFNGFNSGQMSNTNNANPASPYKPALGVYACSTNPASDTLFAGPFDVMSIVVEVPKSMIEGAPFNTGKIHVWATVSSSTAS